MTAESIPKCLTLILIIQ